jgi:ubiquitin carboxyl-terminal hydrolase 25/28
MPPDYFQGVIEEHPLSDDDMAPRRMNASPVNPPEWQTERYSNVDQWKQSVHEYGAAMDVDSDTVERPILGGGYLPKRLLEKLHEHELVRPKINKLPQPSAKAIPSFPVLSPDVSAASTSSQPTDTPLPPTDTPAPEHMATVSEVWEATPGGEEYNNVWYFCTTCWGWMRVIVGVGTPRMLNMEDWSRFMTPTQEETAIRRREWSKYNDLLASRLIAPYVQDHYHEYTTLLPPCPSKRIPRIDVEASVDVFPHKTLYIGEERDSWQFPTSEDNPTRLFISCSSEKWVIADKSIIPGQIPSGLVKSFTLEKIDNPGLGRTGAQSADDAWTLIQT